jgi:hypothetical protein
LDTAGIARTLQGVSQIGKPHQPHGTLDVLIAADLKGDPTRIRNPAVLFRKTIRQKGIANRAWKRNVNDSAHMDLANLGRSESEFAASKAMRMSRHLRPRRYFLLERLEELHSRNLTDTYSMTQRKGSMQFHLLASRGLQFSSTSQSTGLMSKTSVRSIASIGPMRSRFLVILCTLTR